ncbi:MAG TPA: FecR domain-containing protein [Steroidobacteraceae bacterium]|jgi:transmembrane sensor
MPIRQFLQRLRAPAVDPEKAREEAARWLNSLSRGLRLDEGQALREWLKQPANRTAILESARIYHDPDVIAVLSELFPKAEELQKQKPATSFAPIAAMAAIAVVISLASPIFLNRELPWDYLKPGKHLPTVPVERGSYLTHVGEQQTITLKDGTVVSLNTATHMEVALSEHSRDVFIGPNSGEAIFHVAHEPFRPFIVHVGRRMLEAVGTNFNVRVLRPEHIEVTVTEGNVKVYVSEIRLPDTPEVNRLRADRAVDDTNVSALETALVEPGFQFVRKIEESEADERLAWQHGLMYFKAEPLSRALAEASRYTSTRFVLADNKLADIRIAGSFRTGDVEGFLNALRQDFNIASQKDTQGRVILSALQHP